MTIPYLGQFTDPRLEKLKALVAQQSGSPSPDSPDLSPPDDRLAKLKALVAARTVTPGEADAAKATFGETPAGGENDFFQPTVAPAPRQMAASEFDTETPKATFGSYAKQYAAGLGGFAARLVPDVAIQTVRDLARTNDVAASLMQGTPVRQALIKATEKEGGSGIPSSGGSLYEKAQRPIDEGVTTLQNTAVGKPTEPSDVEGRKLGEMAGQVVSLLPVGMSAAERVLGRVSREMGTIRSARAAEAVIPPVQVEPPPPDPQPIESHAQPNPEREPVPSTPLRTAADVQKDAQGAMAAAQEAARRGSSNLAMQYQQQANKYIRELRGMKPPEEVTPSVPDAPTGLPVEAGPSAPPTKQPRLTDIARQDVVTAEDDQKLARSFVNNVSVGDQAWSMKMAEARYQELRRRGIDDDRILGLFSEGEQARGTSPMVVQEKLEQVKQAIQRASRQQLPGPSVEIKKKPTIADLLGKTDAEMEQVLHPSKGLPEGVSAPSQRASVEKITNEAMDQSAVDELVGEQTAKSVDPRLEKLKEITTPIKRRQYTSDNPPPDATEAEIIRHASELPEGYTIPKLPQHPDPALRGLESATYADMARDLLHAWEKEPPAETALRRDAKTGEMKPVKIGKAERDRRAVLQRESDAQAKKLEQTMAQTFGPDALAHLKREAAANPVTGAHFGSAWVGGSYDRLVARRKLAHVSDQDLFDEWARAYTDPNKGPAAEISGVPLDHAEDVIREREAAIRKRAGLPKEGNWETDPYYSVVHGKRPPPPVAEAKDLVLRRIIDDGSGNRFTRPETRLLLLKERGNVTDAEIADLVRHGYEDLGRNDYTLPSEAGEVGVPRKPYEEGKKKSKFQPQLNVPGQEPVPLDIPYLVNEARRLYDLPPKGGARAKPIPATERFTVEPTEKGFGVRDRTRDALIDESTKGGKLRTRHFPTQEAAQAWIDETVPSVQHAEGVIARREAKAKKPLPTAAPAYSADPKTLSERTWYHGSGTAGLSSEKLHTLDADPAGLVGPGVYLSDNPEVSKTYAATRGRKTGTPTLYEAQVHVDKVLDMEAPVAKHPELPASLIRAGERLDEHFDADGAADAVRKAASEPGATGMSVWKALQEAVTDVSHDQQIPKYEFAEFYGDIAGDLRKAGYDAITHQGGTRAGNGKLLHQVLVVLDPSDEARVGRVNNPVRNFREVPEGGPAQRAPEPPARSETPPPTTTTAGVTPKAESPATDPEVETLVQWGHVRAHAERTVAEKDVASDEFKAAKIQLRQAEKEVKRLTTSLIERHGEEKARELVHAEMQRNPDKYLAALVNKKKLPTEPPPIPKRTLKPKAPKPPPPPKTIAFRQSPDEMIARSSGGGDLGLLLTKAQRLIDMANASSDPVELRRIHSQIRPLYDAAGAGDVRGGIIDIGAAINRKIKKLSPPEEPTGPKAPAKVKFAGVEGGNPKFSKMDNDALIARRHQLMDRIDEQNKILDKNVTPFARERDDGSVVGGTSVNKAAGRAIGQIKTAARILLELDDEFEKRGISRDQLGDALDERTERQAIEADENLNPGKNPPGFTAFSHGSVGGGIVGAAAGVQADKKHPGRGALIGAIAGAALGAKLTKVLAANPVTEGKLVTPGIKDDLLTMLAPASRGGGGEEAGYVMRHRFGEQAASEERARESLKGFRRIVAHLSTPDAHRFIDHIEQGQIDVLPKPLQPIALQLRKVLDETRDEIISLGNGRLTHYYETYFPHIWKDPAKARDVIKQILGKRPLEGNKNFLRKRSIMSVSEGLDAGLELATDNPLDLVLLKHREMRRYLMGQRVLNDFKEEGLATFVNATEKPPDGYRRIDDRVAEVRGPGPKGAITIRGHYWAPEPVARVINNHLSPGLRGRPLYDGYMYIGNLMNMVQLGLSAFHLGFTSIDAVVSKVALGILEAKDLHPIKAAKALAEAPLAPATNIWRGVKLRHAYLNGVDDPMVNGIIEGGGRVRMDSFWRNNAAESFLHAVQDRDLKGIGKHAIPAFFDMASKPILEWVVPRQKLGVFADLYSHELAKLPADATPMMRKKIASKVWDSVDNRMGQMVYDNLFWNRTLKDLAFASVRSVGWNLGTIRELGGGALDLSRGKMTPRASYAIALPLTVGLMGAITTYLYTGHGPKSIKDYFLPPTGKVNEDGNQERVQLPSYVKDVIAYRRHPLETLGHKAQPFLATIIDMLKNKDYYGDQIRNRDDPAVQQAIQAATYLARQFIPFGVRNAMQERTHQQSTSTKVGPFFGMTPAPRELVRSPAQQKMAEILGDRGYPSRTPEEVKASETRRTMLDQFRAGTLTKHQIADSARAGVLSHRQALDMQRRGTEPNIVQHFKQLRWQQAENVYSAANADERKLWWPILWKKRLGALDQLLDAGAKTPDVQRLRDLIHRDHLHGPPPTTGASP